MNGRIEIDLEAIVHNARALRELVLPAKSSFVVKSGAYGHGLAEVALAIETLASRFCVYSLDEAIALRDGGITAPILVMGPVPSARLSEALSARAEIALWDTRAYARDVAAAAQRYGARFPVHLKINTGIARLGIEAHDAADALEDLLQIAAIDLTGIFSHLAAAEELDSPFTMLQLERFTHALEAMAPLLQARNLHPIRHIAASAAAMLWPQTRLDMVRFGIALYGLWPSAQTRAAMNAHALALVPALSYRSELVAVREVEAGTPIGYGNAYHAPKRTRIGILPVGYADGIPRLLSNRGAFVVDGARVPIVGRVCMNMTMVDLENAPLARAGSRVTLIGEDGSASVTADDWAAWAETISYEIVARLPSELCRIFSGAATPQAAAPL